jgi:CheY-like chemotaxis protein
MQNSLLADDNASVRETLGKVLASEQYAVSFAATGRAVASKFVTSVPDLAVLDWSSSSPMFHAGMSLSASPSGTKSRSRNHKQQDKL